MRRRSFAWDHPRVRGEKLDLRGGARRRVGSPPRARGKELHAQRSAKHFGITPACAGKSSREDVLTARDKDHPRVRGEKCGRFFRTWEGEGSPPRARGKACGHVIWVAFTGITPACAGKRIRTRLLPRPAQDHPRVRGEKVAFSVWSVAASGSPPRARGKGQHLFGAWLSAGITPACAGKSRLYRKTRRREGDHPRVRGEKPNSLRASVVSSGSPPRARGKAVQHIQIAHVAGITPACAGKRTVCGGKRRFPGDHPRVRGEKPMPIRTLLSSLGSPPRARGKVYLLAVRSGMTRITPACAGKSYP